MEQKYLGNCGRLLQEAKVIDGRTIPAVYCQGKIFRRFYPDDKWNVIVCDNPKCHFLETKHNVKRSHFLYMDTDSFMEDVASWQDWNRVTVQDLVETFHELKEFYWRKGEFGTTIISKPIFGRIKTKVRVMMRYKIGRKIFVSTKDVRTYIASHPRHAQVYVKSPRSKRYVEWIE
jgi:hypothetical protein